MVLAPRDCNHRSRDERKLQVSSMDTSIPQNLTQCAFNFDALSNQPVKNIPASISQAIPQKQCKKCIDSFPATTAYFHRDRSNKDGLFSICKRCRGSKNFGVEPDDSPEGYKRCPECKNVYPLTEEFFACNKAQILGFDYQCKECKNKRERERSRQPEKREKRIVQQKVWNDAHKEEHKEYYKIYNEVNKEAVSGQHKRYRQEHKEAISERSKRYYQANKASHHARVRAYRARERGIAGTHTPEQIEEQFKRQKGRCYYAACGYAKFKKIKGKYVFHVEHTYPLSRVVGSAIPANSIDYLVLACPTCNISKGNKFPWEWVEGGRMF